MIGILELNIHKPRGLTKCGWHEEQAARARDAATRASASA